MKDTKTIETLLEVAEAINTHKYNLETQEKTFLIFKGHAFTSSAARVKHNIAVIERLLIILEKKYNKLLKQLNDEC